MDRDALRVAARVHGEPCRRVAPLGGYERASVCATLSIWAYGAKENRAIPAWIARLKADTQRV